MLWMGLSALARALGAAAVMSGFQGCPMTQDGDAPDFAEGYVGLAH
jgi:hypothetical protein